jgi:acyl dehydratase
MRFFEDVSIGDDLPAFPVGPLTSTHLMRWSSATENWHKIHYDRSFSVARDKLPDILIHGSFKQQLLFRHLMAWAGDDGHVWKVNFQFRAMNVVDEILTIWGRVSATDRATDYGLISIEIGIRNQDGKESTPGSAVVALPYRDGPPIARPFAALDAE